TIFSCRASGPIPHTALGLNRETFDFQQTDLAAEPPAVAVQGAIARQNAVAGNDDADGIAAHSRADCAAMAGAQARPFGQFAIGQSLAAGNFQQRLPDLALKGRAPGCQLHLEDLAFTAPV